MKLKPEDIVFEVVESEYIDDYNHLARILNYYREKGYKTALDDVGSGYATLSEFNILKTDYIKIDMDVVQKAHKSEAEHNYIRQIIKLKHENKVKIIAEGIETQETLDYITKMDVDLLQGYYFGKPSNKLYENMALDS